MGLARILSYIFYGPAWLTFLVMGAAAGGFAVCTYDLFHVLSANFALLSNSGVMAMWDGGLLHLLRCLKVRAALRCLALPYTCCPSLHLVAELPSMYCDRTWRLGGAPSWPR